MPTTYKPADPDVVEMTQRLAAQYHKHLIENKVRIDVVMAFGPVNEDMERTGPALILHGNPCLGIASITKLKERVKGDGDCEIALDGDQWPFMTERQREALVDHELTHFDMLVVDGMQKYDDLGRPRLTMREHDFDVGWFHCIAERYGKDSNEVMQFLTFARGEDGQRYLQHLSDNPPPEEAAAPIRLGNDTKRGASKMERARALLKEFDRIAIEPTVKGKGKSRYLYIPEGELPPKMLVEAADLHHELLVLVERRAA